MKIKKLTKTRKRTIIFLNILLLLLIISWISCIILINSDSLVLVIAASVALGLFILLILIFIINRIFSKSVEVEAKNLMTLKINTDQPMDNINRESDITFNNNFIILSNNLMYEIDNKEMFKILKSNISKNASIETSYKPTAFFNCNPKDALELLLSIS